jgi:hypothetical protein
MTISPQPHSRMHLDLSVGVRRYNPILEHVSICMAGRALTKNERPTMADLPRILEQTFAPNRAAIQQGELLLVLHC